MICQSLLAACLFTSALIAVTSHPAVAQEAPVKADEKKNKPHVRLICVAALKEDQEVILASRDEAGQWTEMGTSSIRSSFITEWLPAQAGELHVAVREQGSLRSLGKFTYPAECRRAMAVLLPAADKASYSAFAVDPEKLSFTKGSVLAVNFSKQNGYLLLGTTKVTVGSGQRVVAKPTPEENGMYRFMVAYQNEENQAVTCYDRYLPASPDSRDLLFLFPDPVQGLKVMNLPMFGDLN
jgi:hypothetical protein